MASRGIYLQWEGKRVYCQRIATPRVLEPVANLSVGSGTNMVIEGDNIQVLASLRAQYGAAVKLIYADPPYNTGQRDFRYSDRRFHDPDADDTDAVYVTNEDGGKHTKWLNYMAPRLSIMLDLLRSDGAIMVSIDDNEVFRLGMLMDEIFGEENHVATFIWQKHHSRNNSARHVAATHDFILMYAKDKSRLNVRRLAFDPAEFKNPDNDPNGAWVSRDLSANHFYAAGKYKVKSPGGKTFGPTKGRYWSVSEAHFLDLNEQGRIWWGKKNNSRPRKKVYESEMNEDPEAVPVSIWPAFEVGHNQEATSQVRDLGFADASQHSPKPVRLIKRCIDLVCEKDEQALILDAFAGTGTTAQAVLDLNHQDKGNRRFILIEQGTPTEPYCRTLTAERIKRAIEKYGYGDGFTFYKTGRKIDRQAIVSLERDGLTALICQADETGRGREISRLQGYKYIIGKNHRNEAICLKWNGGGASEVTKDDLRAAAEEVTKGGLKRPFRIYGTHCRVGDTASWKFCQIPDEILAQLHIIEDMERD
ncbi:MAG TPA: site-specific DNA-methyltransferase [Tepidisphaeraceae bacterium]|nr:site-specific DNA-methyltransferase [Tepidisphaeraceae bacterium]